MPPLVEPEHAPMNMQKDRTTHVTCGHSPASSLKKPVVVMNAVTWKRLPLPEMTVLKRP